jgi:hypothetical protein
MVAPVDFDNQTVSDRREIGNIRANRPLPAEFVSGQSAIAQRHPEPTFGIG